MTLTYIKRIRNPHKQRYAMDYACYIQEKGHLPEPDTKDYNISYMAAQAVRNMLSELMK